MIDLKEIGFFYVLGVRVHIVNMSEVLNAMERWVESHDKGRYIVATQMHGVMEGRRDPGFRDILNSADLFVPDGFSMVWAARSRGFKLRERVPGPDLFREGCRLAEERGYGIFLYGDTQETLSGLTNKLNEEFPNLRISGVFSPPFRPLTLEEDNYVVDMINNSGADIVWVGLGAPKQEKWMAEHRDKLDVSVLVGVGAAFKFGSGQITRAPSWIRGHGLEWLWRFCQEPRRLWRRVMIDGPHFMMCVMLECIDSKMRGSTRCNRR